MTFFSFTLFSLLFFSTGCDLRKREEEVKKQLERIDEKEQELALREKNIVLKEQDILRREQKLDSTGMDSVMAIDSSIIGRWNVKMTCVETTCPGSAVGNVKNEDWELTFEGNQLIARAMNGDNLIRIYTGIYTGNTIEMVANIEGNHQQVATKMVVRLRIINKTT